MSLSGARATTADLRAQLITAQTSISSLQEQMAASQVSNTALQDQLTIAKQEAQIFQEQLGQSEEAYTKLDIELQKSNANRAALTQQLRRRRNRHGIRRLNQLNKYHK